MSLRSLSVTTLLAGILLLDPPGRHLEAADPLLWPVQADPAMTSSFGEYRPGHIHAGLDIKTWGRIGVPLVAVEAGSVRRVRVSPFGYGKSLYLELADGRSAVYAHMDRFTAGLEQIIWERQQQARRYSVDIWFDPGEQPVGRGAVVGFSGQTATSAPHLHFELRDRENNPLNPLLHGLSVKDTTPPVIEALIVRPHGPDSRVDGEVRVRRYGLSTRQGVHVLRGRPEVDGAVAFSVAAHDAMDGTWNAFSPYGLALEVDGVKRFEVRYDRFSYQRAELIDLDRDYRYMVREGLKAHTLFRQRGNTLPFYGDYPEGAGYLTGLTPGVHRLTVLVSDASGNESRLEGEILVNRAPVVEDLRISEDPDRPGELRVEGSVSDPDGDPVSLQVEVAEPGGGRDAPTSWGALADGDVSMEGGRVTARLSASSGGTEGGDGLLVRVTAEDRWRRASLPVLLAHGERPAPDEPRLTLSVERYEDHLLTELSFEPGLVGTVTFELRGEGGVSAVSPGRPAGSGRFVGSLAITPSDQERLEVVARMQVPGGREWTDRTDLRIVTVRADGEARFVSNDGGLQIRFPAGSLYDDGFVMQSSRRTAAGLEVQALLPLSPVYGIGPEDIPFRTSAALSLETRSLPPDVRAGQVALFTSGTSPDAPWVWLGGTWSDGRLAAGVGGLGPFVAMADTVRPDIRILTPRDGAELRTGTPRFDFLVEDNASGFADDLAFVLRIDGTQVIAEYDPIRDRIRYVPREPLSSGDHWIRLDATDQAGNLRSVSARVRIR